MIQHQVYSSRVRITRWYPTEAAAIAAYERKCKREGILEPLHYPGHVAGDGFEREGLETTTQGIRDGHGNLYHVKRRRP